MNSAAISIIVSTSFQFACRPYGLAVRIFLPWSSILWSSTAVGFDKHIDRIPEEAISALILYYWPGNVRELQNLIERAVILSRDGVLPNPLPTDSAETITVVSKSRTLKEVDRALILEALEAADWMIGGPA